MKYMLLVHHDEAAFDRIEKEKQLQMLAESIQLTHVLDAGGKYLSASPLEPAAAAAIVRVREGKPLVTDGPFIETREQIAGYFLIEAESLQEAIGIAAGVPGARIGSVEVRPVREISGLPVRKSDREYLRHCLATLAYRAAKTMRGAPESFASFRPGPGSKTSVEIVAHMGDLFDWGISMARGTPRWNGAVPQGWEQECARFFAALKAFDDFIASEEEIRYDLKRLFQGPIADALTHTGQLAMMRRLHGAPMKGESYNNADVAIGRTGPDQKPPNPKFEFD